ncbi:hypothetical protein CMUS01_07618 [Colletotrichum musicola]|uniref:Uncharacterized protein n=1 Tax=Colletotrichum musicola TaxID=2175873 RepID=A0A8H6KFX1_9PEZI|nr:hypothetical protein CMUS01_07618 [Colletotrichum musicola]
MGKIQPGPDFMFSSGHEASSKSSISPSSAPHISGWLPRTPSGLSPASESRQRTALRAKRWGVPRQAADEDDVGGTTNLEKRCADIDMGKESGSEAEVVGPAIPTLGGHALADAMDDFCDSTMNFTWDVDPLGAEETCDWVEMRAASRDCSDCQEP